MTLQDAIRKLGGFKETGSDAVLCKVKSVNGLNCECEPVNDDADIQDVRLVTDDAEDGFVIVPEVGSYVIVQMLNATAGYIAMVSKISEVYYKVGTAEYNVKADGHLIQKGNDTLKDVLTLMVEAVQQITVIYGNNPDYGKLTQALTKINNLLR